MRPALKDVERVVCDKFGLSRDEMRGPARVRYIARPRQIAMYLAREMTQESLPRIGMYFCRDHTTVLHALRSVRRLVANDPYIFYQVEECRKAIPGWNKMRAHRIAAANKDRWPDAGEQVLGSG